MHAHVELFNQTLLSIFHNFIRNKIFLCDNKKHPWMNGKIKILIKRKNVHAHVELSNQTLLSIFHNFIRNKIFLCDNKKHPWMNGKIKILIKRKNWLFQCQRKSGNLDYASFDSITQDISNAVNSSVV